MSLEFFKVDVLDKKKKYGMTNPLLCHGVNYLQNQVPLENFWARGAKWGCMTKSHCQVMAMNMVRIIPNSLKTLNGVVIHLIQVFNSFTKQQGCKEPCKIKNVTIFRKFKTFLERLKGITQSKLNCDKTFDVRHDAKRYRVQCITRKNRLMEHAFFSIISFFK